MGRTVEIDAEVYKDWFYIELSPDKHYDYDTDQAKKFLIKLEEDAFQRETFLKKWGYCLSNKSYRPYQFREALWRDQGF